MKKGMHIDHRLIKIVDEMLVFFYSLSSTNIKMEIIKEEEFSEIVFEAYIREKIDNFELEKIEKLLSAPRQHEMEEYYWGLTGNDTTPSTELVLVGMMVDEHDTYYDFENDIIKIRLRRYKVRK